MSEERDVGVCPVIEVERAFGVVLSDVMVNKNSDMGFGPASTENLEDETLVRIDLGLTMSEDKLDR